MNADRFGLAALHQLRGRVGRKGDQGYCCLVSDTSNEKLAAMTMFPSGFKIARWTCSCGVPAIFWAASRRETPSRGYDPPLPEVGGGHPQLFSNKGVTWYDKTGNYDRLCRLFGNSAGRQGPEKLPVEGPLIDAYLYSSVLAYLRPDWFQSKKFDPAFSDLCRQLSDYQEKAGRDVFFSSIAKHSKL